MARPLRENRNEVADVTLTIRITGPERAALDELVARRAVQLGDLGGSVSAASVVRALIRQAAQGEGLLPVQVRLPVAAPSSAPLALVLPVEKVAKVAEPKPQPVAVDNDSLRARFLAARDAARITNADVAKALRFADGSVISRWSKAKSPLPAKHWPTVDGLLRKAGF